MKNDDFLIPLSGLASTKQEFEWLADKEFFESFDNAEILDAQVVTRVSAEKANRQILIDCDLVGWVEVPCDRCLSPVRLEVDEIADLALVREASQEVVDSEREEITLTAEQAEFDMKQVVYDYICTSLPLKKVHEDGDCDEAVVSRLEKGEFIAPSDDAPTSDIDSPFAQLQNVFKK